MDVDPVVRFSHGLISRRPQMKFIVKPEKKAPKERFCKEFITMCVLCSEDPRWCI